MTPVSWPRGPWNALSVGLGFRLAWMWHQSSSGSSAPRSPRDLVDQALSWSLREKWFLCCWKARKPLLQIELGIHRCELVGTVEAIVPNQHLFIHHDLLVGRAWIPRNNADSCPKLPGASCLDLLLRALNTREDDFSQDSDPVHALGRQILDRAVVCKASVRSQTLEQSQDILSGSLHVRPGVVLENRGCGCHAPIFVARSGCTSDLIIAEKVESEFESQLLGELLHAEKLGMHDAYRYMSPSSAHRPCRSTCPRKDIPAARARHLRDASDGSIAPACEVPLHVRIKSFLIEAILTPLMGKICRVESRRGDRRLASHAKERPEVAASCAPLAANHQRRCTPSGCHGR